ncbi:hypothetical protein DRQ20_00660 [bacterium]|nr:MAG: hypothetical protein DRQ20_00660 [bacterium]
MEQRARIRSIHFNFNPAEGRDVPLPSFNGREVKMKWKVLGKGFALGLLLYLPFFASVILTKRISLPVEISRIEKEENKKKNVKERYKKKNPKDEKSAKKKRGKEKKKMAKSAEKTKPGGKPKTKSEIKKKAANNPPVKSGSPPTQAFTNGPVSSLHGTGGGGGLPSVYLHWSNPLEVLRQSRNYYLRVYTVKGERVDINPRTWKMENPIGFFVKIDITTPEVLKELRNYSIEADEAYILIPKYLVYNACISFAEKEGTSLDAYEFMEGELYPDRVEIYKGIKRP